MTESHRQPPSLRRKVILSAAWLLGTRWLLRLVGLASTMALARLLMPEDFGIVAAVTALVAILNGFFDFGFNVALIQAKEYRREDYDTAWTMRILKSAAFGLLVMAASPLVAAYAHDPNLIAISIVLGIGLTVRGFDNIGTVRYERQMQYDRLFGVRLYPRLVGVVATVTLAFWLRSYWAIVLGTFVQQVAFTAFSFVLCDFRPRFRLQGAASLWNFSKWILISSLSRQIYGALDRFTLSGLISKRELGFFSVSSSLAAMVSTELVGAAGAALIPGYAKLQDEPGRLRAAFTSSQSALAAMLLPVTLALVFLAQPVTLVVLGVKWIEAAPMLAAFGIFFFFYTLAENLNSFMAVTGLQMSAAKTGATRTLAFLLLVYPAYHAGGVLAVIGLKSTLSLFEVLYLASGACRRIGAPVSHYLREFARPGLAAVIMGGAMWAVDRVLQLPALFELVVVGAAGVSVYLGSLMCLWIAWRRPNGLERLLIDAWQRMRRRLAGS
jgi:lipopolysaccharide exporter